MAKKRKYIQKFENAYKSAANIMERLSSKASMENLQGLQFPELNLEKNEDIMPFATDAAVVNMINKNGDILDAKTAIEVAKLFIHKPMNIEHEDKDIIGHIVTTGWSSYGESFLLKDEDINELTTEPFNLVIGGVCYIKIDIDLAKILLEQNNKEQNAYEAISTSWEIDFNKYDIVISKTAFLKDATQIITDEKEKLKYKAFLKSNKGSGRLADGSFVGRLIKGDVLPRGAAFTINPAADVKGVKVLEDVKVEDDEEDEEIPETETPETENSEASTQISEENKENSVINGNISNNKNMSLKDILDKMSSEDAEIARASVAEEVKASVEAAAEAWNEKITAASKEKEAIASKLAEIEQSCAAKDEQIASLQDAIQKSNAQCEEIMKTMAAEKAEKSFNDRMSSICSEYNIDEEEQSVVAKQIKGMDEESYASWYGDYSVMSKAKKKCASAKASATEPKEEKTPEELLEKATASAQEIPNTKTPEQSFADRFKGAFKVTVSQK